MSVDADRLVDDRERSLQDANFTLWQGAVALNAIQAAGGYDKVKKFLKARQRLPSLALIGSGVGLAGISMLSGASLKESLIPLGISTLPAIATVAWPMTQKRVLRYVHETIREDVEYLVQNHRVIVSAPPRYGLDMG